MLKSNTQRAQEEEEANQQHEKLNRDYHECVEEIKNENIILGSLELHHEAMRRLKQKQGPQDNRMLLYRHHRNSETKRFRSLAHSVRRNTTNLANSLQIMTQITTRRKSSIAAERINSNDPHYSKSVIIGRRSSNVDQQVGFDPTITDAQVMMRDLELSDDDDNDSDWEEEEEEGGSSGMPEPPWGDDYGDDGNGSLLPSGEHTRVNGGGGGGLKTLFRRGSSMFSDDDEDNGRVVSRQRRPSVMMRTSARIKRASSLRNNALRHSFNSSSVTIGEEENNDILSPDEEFKSNGEEGTMPETNEEGKRKTTKEPPLSIPNRRANRRIGRRRPSLFSVDESRASITTSVGHHSSITSLLSGESLKGSFTSSSSKGNNNFAGSAAGASNRTLICNFRHQNSSFALEPGDDNDDEDDDDLICGWDRKSSQLSDSGTTSRSIQEELLNEGEDKISALMLHRHHDESNSNNVSLICGWDQQQQSSDKRMNFHNGSNRSLLCDWAHESQLSNSVLSNPPQQYLEDEDEKILTQTKEGCSLFDVR
mmetsp:Transcript_20742/g.37221  ORF Transcript_20742/g.37221 Transcript_20742/m.37221 type:complete len:537 (+) Transcript_20742:143-1753(+)|eukprot:CAMPEP_0201626310 /NCGR_PEP_ID=MMETSP0493-20130528/1756_1 /ASSEMBLY_ACC=CAM_ASM_000838 /TAXON_ID=420259 /ORGANISM="Thalassiosira gravida, Strain GMp14c1" /LENGTH=536 /DNA_ID=CAMNT_0048096397 /DNA_START=71 /DNA_END=1681 /DNA_ORIENTATION=-